VNGTNGAADWTAGVTTEPVESKVGTADQVTQAVILDQGDANTQYAAPFLEGSPVAYCFGATRQNVPSFSSK
jgi:hypothetical protein